LNCKSHVWCIQDISGQSLKKLCHFTTIRKLKDDEITNKFCFVGRFHINSARTITNTNLRTKIAFVQCFQQVIQLLAILLRMTRYIVDCRVGRFTGRNPIRNENCQKMPGNSTKMSIPKAGIAHIDYNNPNTLTEKTMINKQKNTKPVVNTPYRQPSYDDPSAQTTLPFVRGTQPKWNRKVTPPTLSQNELMMYYK
jgi:hypothetical protein